MKKSILVFSILCLIAPMIIEAKKKSFGEGLYWNLSNGILTISGHGPMPNGSPYDSNHEIFPWRLYKHKDKIKTIIIENGVQTVGSNAFRDLESVESVSLSNSVTAIQYNAFYGCKNLSLVNFPNGIQKIRDEAFAFCHSLKNINLPSSIRQIDSKAFYGCANIKMIKVDSGCPIYDSRNNCNAIIETEKNNLLLGCCNTVIPNTVISIGPSAFLKCNLTSITIPNNVKSIGEEAFAYCYSLKTVDFPDTVYISRKAFYYCDNIETVFFHNVDISSRAFMRCENLKDVTIENFTGHGLGSNVFELCKNLRSIKIKKGMWYIGEKAFYGCSSLVDAVFPNSVGKIDKYAFSGCKKLVLNIPNSVKNIDNGAFAEIDNQENIVGYFSGKIRCLPTWLSDKGNSEWKRIGLDSDIAKMYFSCIHDDKGNVIYEPKNGGKFKQCSYLEKKIDFYIVEENGKEGLLNSKGDWIIPLSHGYTNLHFVNYGHVRVRKGAYYGIISVDKKELISLQRGYTYISDYDSGKGTYNIRKNGYSGVCDWLGKEISLTKLPPNADDIKTYGGYVSAVEMKNGSTKYYKVSKNGRYGLTDAEGRIIVPVELDVLESAGTGYLRYKLNGFWGLINYQGKVLIDTDRGYTSIGDFKSFNKRFAYTMNGYKGECDATGRQISKIKVDTPRSNTSVASSSGSSSSSNSSSNNSGNKTTTVVVEHQHTPQPFQQWQACWACGGSGTMGCDFCGGGGTKYIGDRLDICSRCRGKGEIPCNICYGNKGQYITVYR